MKTTYKPIKPQADNETLANESSRMMLIHERFLGYYFTARLYIAPKGEVCSGWVIGTHAEEQKD